MYKKLSVILFMLSVSTLHAQTDFRPGYVITNSYDTIYGQIDYRGDKLMGEICKFKSTGDNITEYSPRDIVAYRFTDSKYFVSKEVAGKIMFLEFLIKGQVNIYYLRDSSGDHYYIDKGDAPIAEIPYEEKIITVNNKTLLYKSKKHIGLLGYYMQDAPEIQTQIAKIKKPDHNDLIKVAENYHHDVCKDGEECIIFEKKQPFIKISVDLTAGLVSDRNMMSSSFQGGVLLNLWMPRANEKIYFRTGLLYSKIEDNESDNLRSSTQSIYKIPIMFEYMYSKFIIRPKAAYGISLYYINGGIYAVSVMGGINIRLNKSMSCILEYQTDFEPHNFPLIPKNLGLQAFMTGLNISF